MPGQRRRYLALTAAAATLLLADQALHRAVLLDGRLNGRRVAPFDPPLFTAAQERWLERIETGGAVQGELEFDSLLGWSPRPGATANLYAYDWAGARIAGAPLPRERTPGVRRIVAVGGSFVRGDEVEGEECWAGRLDAELDVELVNLGVGGFGLDQALLRWERDGSPLDPDEVWLGFCPAVSLRVLSTYWPSMHHWKQSVATKPRFTLGDDGELALAENPAASREELARILRDQSAFMQHIGAHDAWVRAVPAAYAPAGTHWLHHSGLGRLYLTWREARGRDVRARLTDPTDELFRLLAALVVRARGSAEASGAGFRLLVLPDKQDLAAARAGRRPWARLIAEVESAGVTATDLTDTLLAAGADRDGTGWRPGGHYGPELNAVVADALRDLASGD
jgi:hypothetical protein